MYNRNTFKTYQSMNLILKNENGGELWLGDYYSATDLSLLSQKNIKAVLTVAANMEISYPAEIEIKHKIINALDLPTYRMNPHFVISNKFIHDSLQKGENVLVHCAAGISRSVTCVIAYLMKKKQYGYKQALIYVQNRRSVASPNYGFELELKNYYEKVCSERKKAEIKINEKEKNKTAACLRPKIKKQENKLIKSFGRENIGKLPPIQNSWKDEKVYQPKIVIIKK